MEAETYKEVGMSTVVFDISMSLDGFITASGRRPEEPMGDGGQRLHEWAFGEDERNREFFERSISELGAVIAGRNTYDDSLPWWGTDGPTGPARRPCSWSRTRRPRRVPRVASTPS
jgi:dihydrofolate reductase